MMGDRAREKPSHISSPALKAFGSPRLSMSRFSRRLLDHAPRGSIRRRFFHDETWRSAKYSRTCNTCCSDAGTYYRR